MSSTQSGSFPPGLAATVHSDSHVWIREHYEKLKGPLHLTYRPVNPEELREVANLHREWFPLPYTEFDFANIGVACDSIAAVLNPADYGDFAHSQPVIIGLLIYELLPGSGRGCFGTPPSSLYLSLIHI